MAEAMGYWYGDRFAARWALGAFCGVWWVRGPGVYRLLLGCLTHGVTVGCEVCVLLVFCGFY